MKTKRILSITLIMSLVLSLFTVVMPSVSAEPTNPDTESYYIDFSKYDFHTITAENYNKYVEENPGEIPTHANMYDINLYNGSEVGNWSLVEDSNAAGGKYLNFVKANTGANGGLYSYMFVANPTGDYATDGNHVVLTEGTTYYMTVRYKITDLSEGYNLNLFTFASSGVATPNNVTNWQDRVDVKLGLKNTDGWVEAIYSFKTPDTYTGTSIHSLMVGFETRVDGKTSRPAEGTAFTYNLSVDYIKIEKPEFNPQHMEVDFNNYTPYYTNNTNCSINKDGIWEIGTEGENKYFKHPDTKLLNNTSSAPYCFVVNPTGAGAYAKRAEQYILVEGAEYRVSFKYRLPALVSNGAVTVKVGATAGTNSAGSWSAANTAIALTPEEGTTGITLEQTSEWKTVSYTFTMTTTATGTDIRRVMQMAFVPNGVQRPTEYALDIDDIVVDRLATVTIKDEAGNTTTQKGAPAAPVGTTGMGGNAAEVIELSSLNAEVYNGSTANTGVIKYYNDKEYTQEISSYTFGAVSETIYSKLQVLQSDVNQVAFCGFDEYKLRSSCEKGNTYGNFVYGGYYNTDTEHVWDIVDTDVYTGTKSMHMALSGDYNAARKFLYIGSGYEFEDNVTYQLSLRVKKNTEIEQDGYLKISLGGGGDVYGRFIYGQDSSNIQISAEEISSEWTEIKLLLTFIPQTSSTFGDMYSVDYYRAPTLRFETDSNVAVYIDTITLSTVCGSTAAEVIDTNTEDNKQEVRVTSSYIVNDSDKVVLAGNEYDVVERGILAKASTNTSKLIAGEDGVLFVKKTENLDDYWADGENGEKIFAMLIEGISVNDHREITARSYVKLSDGNTYYSPETTFSVGDSNAPAGYSLVWGDEFDGTELDTTKWNKEYNVSAPLYQTDSKDVMSVENGMLNLNVTRHVGSNTNLKYDVPMGLTTSKTMNYAYGYLEVRARVPYQKGLSSAFWFRSNGQLSKDSGTKLSDTLAEIDMIETLTFTDRVTPNIHKWLSSGEEILHTQYNSGSGNTSQQYVFDSENLCDEFHIYGFEWTETEIKMYVDRVLYATYDITKDYEKTIDAIGDMAAFKDPAHIIIGMKPQLAESGAYDYYGDGSGYATDDTVFETPYSIDWIRLYQKDDTGMLLK